MSLVKPVFPPTKVMRQSTESLPRLNLWLNWIVYSLTLPAVVAFAAGLLRIARVHKLFP